MPEAPPVGRPKGSTGRPGRPPSPTATLYVEDEDLRAEIAHGAQRFQTTRRNYLARVLGSLRGRMDEVYLKSYAKEAAKNHPNADE